MKEKKKGLLVNNFQYYANRRKFMQWSEYESTILRK